MNFAQEIKNHREAWLLRAGLLLTSLLSTAAVLQFRDAAIASGFLDISEKWRLGTSLLFALPGIFWLGTLLSLTQKAYLFKKISTFSGKALSKTGKTNWALFLACLGSFCYLMVWSLPFLTSGFFTRLFLFWIFGLAGFAFLSHIFAGLNWKYLALLTPLVFMASYQIAYALPGITNYPFSLSWSETSNYFYSSLFLSTQLYGTPAPLPFFNPGRALLGVFPFLFPNPQIWVSRLWSVLLWLGGTSLSAWLVARRLRLKDRRVTLLFTLWAFLFILQAPIYVELLLSVALVAWLFNGQKFWRTLGVVIAASAWAGICRVNWFPMPGMFAGLLYLLETPLGEKKRWQYFLKPAAWIVPGLLAAVGVFLIYAAVSGNPTSNTAVAVQSPLLWYRLLPNSTNPLGVLPEAVLVALPALVLVAMWAEREGRRFDAWRKAGAAAILALFFAGGLVVSTKIGGGSNIHNLDAFWYLLLVVAGYLYFSRAAADRSAEKRSFRLPAVLTAALVAAPILLELTASPVKTYPGPNIVNEVLNEVQHYVSAAVQKGEQVLFIDNKQLVTYGYMPSIPMVSEYETGYILEMAMTGNQPYFQKFRQDLKDKRFGVIVAYPQPKQLQDQAAPFSEENNAQVTWIGNPLLCYYQEAYIRLDVSIEVFTPRLQPQDCP